MDDCSPDDTPQVATSFKDSRIIHIRNESNLGHLKNYNKGISWAKGKYVWLISADDFLRCSSIVERYIEVMEGHPQVGYIFCPAVRFQDGRETEVVGWSVHGHQDRVFPGHEFLTKLLLANCVCAPTGMVRKVCYDRVGLFPLSMPNSGDWYLWCHFALYHAVAYLAEPMVCYRTFGENMSEGLKKHNPRVITEDNFRVRWTVREEAQKSNFDSIVTLCDDTIATYYANLIAAEMYEPNIYRLTFEECRKSIEHFSCNIDEQVEMLVRVYSALGDQCYLRRDYPKARENYMAALQHNPSAITTWAKFTILRLGRLGIRIRDLASSI